MTNWQHPAAGCFKVVIWCTCGRLCVSFFLFLFLRLAIVRVGARLKLTAASTRQFWTANSQRELSLTKTEDETRKKEKKNLLLLQFFELHAAVRAFSLAAESSRSPEQGKQATAHTHQEQQQSYNIVSAAVKKKKSFSCYTVVEYRSKKVVLVFLVSLIEN